MEQMLKVGELERKAMVEQDSLIFYLNNLLPFHYMS